MTGPTSASICNACTQKLLPKPDTLRSLSEFMFHRQHFTRALSSVAVIIVSHNYGKFLSEAIESVLNQTLKAAEIVVVDIASSDNTSEIAQQYADQKVKLIRIEENNVHVARRNGFHHSRAPIICFLDADDILPSDYLRDGIKALQNHPTAAIAYSDLQCFGDATHRITFPDMLTSASISANNQIHAGALVRRDALLVSQALQAHLSSDVARLTGDWWIWKKLLSDGWTAVKQSTEYLYRRHESSALKKWVATLSYFDTAHLVSENVTLFLSLSGRHSLWARMSRFLEEQSWPHDQIERSN